MHRGKHIIIFIVCLLLVSCRMITKEKDGRLVEIHEVTGFASINGFKVEEGRFYFSGVKENLWRFYSLDITNKTLEVEHHDIRDYDLYIPLDGDDAIYVDMEGRLFYRREGIEMQVDDEVYGFFSPNVLIAPNRRGILYTKGSQKNAKLFVYVLGQQESILVTDPISEEAYYTFSYTNHWSNNGRYFIFNNNEVYDTDGNFIISIKGTAAKWSPDDSMIAFIRQPGEIEKKKIFAGDWVSYIGEELALFYITEKRDETIYRDPTGLIDIMDSIQWSKDSTKVGISLGDIERSPEGELERVDYKAILVYDIPEQKEYMIEEMPYNYFEILFDTYVYGNNLGKREKMEFVKIKGKDRTQFLHPLMLNSRDMFVISHKDNGYFINGRNIMKINPQGETIVMIELPWDVSEMYFDPDTRHLIIINDNMNIFLLKV